MAEILRVQVENSGSCTSFLASKLLMESFQFCSTRNIEWSFIPERSPPHFGGLWEAAVKRAKSYLKQIVGDTKLTLTQFQPT